MALDNSCFGYTIKHVQLSNGEIKLIEMCTPLHSGSCENCKFYKASYVLQHDRAVAEMRNKKIISGKLKTKYSLTVNGNNEGIYESIVEIDQWLMKSRYSILEAEKLDLDEIYKFNKIEIKKEEVN